MKTYNITVTQDKLDNAMKWKDLADKYNLSISDMWELVYHIEQIQKLISKKK
jgi:hypothetical protein